jgi:hypothetical protein
MCSIPELHYFALIRLSLHHDLYVPYGFAVCSK